jgi:hypothetical protein
MVTFTAERRARVNQQLHLASKMYWCCKKKYGLHCSGSSRAPSCVRKAAPDRSRMSIDHTSKPSKHSARQTRRSTAPRSALARTSETYETSAKTGRTQRAACSLPAGGYPSGSDSILASRPRPGRPGCLWILPKPLIIQSNRHRIGFARALFLASVRCSFCRVFRPFVVKCIVYNNSPLFWIVAVA